MNQQGQPPIMNAGFSLEQLDGFEPIICHCGNDEFANVMKIKELPAVLSPTGHPGIVRMQFLRCTICGAEMNPVTGVSKERDGGKDSEQKED